MATMLSNLLARRAAICAELASLSSTAAGGKPNTSGDGVNVDHVGYKDGLYRELAELDRMIKQTREIQDYADGTDGPFEIDVRGVPS